MRLINSGKDFENQIKDSIPDSVYYYRLKDPANSFGQDSSKTRFSLTNPFDFIMYENHFMYAVENKSKATESLSWTLDAKEKGKDIKSSQLLALFEAYKKGVISGLLINFRSVEETYFLHIKDFFIFAKDSTKRSINRTDVIKHKGFLVPQTKKKVKFKYDIIALIEHCEKTYEEYLYKG